MKPVDFDAFLLNCLNHIQETLKSKETVYSSDKDRFHNFNRAAEMDHTTPIKSLRGMQTKHRVAIADFLDEPNVTDTPYEEWEEKIIDNINYYILMLAMVKELHSSYFVINPEDLKDINPGRLFKTKRGGKL
jgi:hypothetical protein